MTKILRLLLLASSYLLSVSFASMNFVFENEDGAKAVNGAKVLLDWCVTEIYHYQDTTRYQMEENARNVSRFFQATNTSIEDTQRYLSSIFAIRVSQQVLDRKLAENLKKSLVREKNRESLFTFQLSNAELLSI